jgi:hypothetical protein
MTPTRKCQKCSKVINSGRLCYPCWQEWCKMVDEEADIDFVNDKYNNTTR